jgi:hypothetical protein
LTVSNGTVYALADDGSLSAFRADAVDTTGPEYPYTYPPSGQQVNGQPPVVIAAQAIDAGTGLNPDSLILKLDGRTLEASFDPDRNLIIYVTRSSGKIVDPPLADGRHTVTVSAADWRGNKSEQVWSFVVNNALPANSPRTAPAPPRSNRSTTPRSAPAQGGGGTPPSNP